MRQIDFAFVRDGFEAVPVKTRYIAAAGAGLWASEARLFTHYFATKSRILDIGIGTGRTAMGLFRRGYRHVCGIDLSMGMLRAAHLLAAGLKPALTLCQMNACALAFKDSAFDNALFSFNGLMQIPGRANRLTALREIRRVVKPGGYFIFTTQDRDDPAYAEYWARERERWQSGAADPRLIEFGDGIFPDDGREVYVHFPTRDEVRSALLTSGWAVLEVRDRRDIASESSAVERTHCIFWVVVRL